MAKRKRDETKAVPARAEEEDVQMDDDAGSDAEEAIAAGVIPASVLEAKKAKVAIFHADGLKAAFESVRQDGLPWIERLEVVSAEPIGHVDVNDDLKLELAFYGQALAAVTAARGELERLGVAHRRPDDYFAEMIKSDSHMARVKDKLLFEQKKMSAVDARKKRQSAAEFGKEVASERLKARAADKKATLDSLASWRKQRGRHGNSATGGAGGSDGDIDAMLDGRGGGGAPRGEARGGKPNFKRAGKDKKYGFGGQPKRVEKGNDARSSKSLRDFKPGRNKALPPGVKPKTRGGAKGKDGKRPGQAARAAKKARR